MSLSHSS